jgi:dienelactone hydrolase
MMHHLVLCLLLAQEPRFAFTPPVTGIVLTKDVQYGTSGTTALSMDIYRPPNAAGARLPVLIFFNRATGADRSQPLYSAWARAAASKGLLAILPDLRDGSEAKDFAVLVSYITEHAADLGLDRDKIAVYAGSGNVFSAFPAVEDPAQTAIKAAVMYYGTAPIAQFRLDLPVLYVRAGLDRPGVNRSITELMSRAVSQNAPITLLNHPTGHHGFEIADDDDATREVIDRTLDFVIGAVSPAYQAAIRRALPEAAAAGHVLGGNFHQAASIYADLLSSRPDDARLRLAYGEALLGDQQYASACAEFERLKGKGLGARDLGLPAARACMLKGDADAAIAWLRGIPQRFLPADVEKEPVFAPLQDRAEFRALFVR